MNMSNGNHFLKIEIHFKKPDQGYSSGFAISLRETGNEINITKTFTLLVNKASSNNLEITLNPLGAPDNPNAYV